MPHYNCDGECCWFVYLLKTTLVCVAAGLCTVFGIAFYWIRSSNQRDDEITERDSVNAVYHLTDRPVTNPNDISNNGVTENYCKNVENFIKTNQDRDNYYNDEPSTEIITEPDDDDKLYRTNEVYSKGLNSTAKHERLVLRFEDGTREGVKHDSENNGGCCRIAVSENAFLNKPLLYLESPESSISNEQRLKHNDENDTKSKASDAHLFDKGKKQQKKLSSDISGKDSNVRTKSETKLNDGHRKASQDDIGFQKTSSYHKDCPKSIDDYPSLSNFSCCSVMSEARLKLIQPQGCLKCPSCQISRTSIESKNEKMSTKKAKSEEIINRKISNN